MTSYPTPGPWKAFPAGTDIAIMANLGKDYSYPRVAFVHTGEADALRVAAVPEMEAEIYALKARLEKESTYLKEHETALAKARLQVNRQERVITAVRRYKANAYLGEELCRALAKYDEASNIHTTKELKK